MYLFALLKSNSGTTLLELTLEKNFLGLDDRSRWQREACKLFQRQCQAVNLCSLNLLLQLIAPSITYNISSWQIMSAADNAHPLNVRYCNFYNGKSI